MAKQVRGGGTTVKVAKKVSSEPQPEHADRYLVWRFGRLDHEGTFACGTLDPSHVANLEHELTQFQSEPIWSLRKKKWLKFVPASDMTAAGQGRLSEINDQEDGLWQLHLTRDKWRVWGYFDDPEFFFVWWDSGHAVATGKSHNRKA